MEPDASSVKFRHPKIAYCQIFGSLHNAAMSLPNHAPDQLPAAGIVASLSPSERGELCSYGEFITHPKGDTVVEQGLTQAFLHLVLEGELRVILKSDEAILPLGYVQAGECVGEMSLLEPVDASATVLANSTSKVWAISRARFEEFTDVNPAVAAKLLKAIAIQLGSRLRKGSERLLDAES